MPKRTKIVATVGPACGELAMLRRMMEAGVDLFRINFSHGDHEQRAAYLEKLRLAEQEVGRAVAICGDLCGPKIRVGMIVGGSTQLESGEEIVVSRQPIEGSSRRISTTLPELVDVVREGEIILLADGRLRLEVVRTSPPDSFTCKVVVGGSLGSGKGVNLPQTQLPVSTLTEKDQDDIEWIVAHDFDFVAQSFVQRADDVRQLRRLLERGGSTAQIIAKIEKPQALDHIDAIIGEADAIMVARGDLGVEMDYPTVPIAQKSIAAKCQVAGKPCVIATEMLESMINSTRPTRAEVSDVANAVFDDADAVMLSAESSIGRYPVEAVTAMRRTVEAAERSSDELREPTRTSCSEPKTTAALAASIRKIREMESIAAIVLYTATGTTARLIAKNRPTCPILALSAEVATVRRTCLYYGVIPFQTELPRDTERLLEIAEQKVKSAGIAERGDRIIVVGGHPMGQAGATNFVVVQPVG